MGKGFIICSMLIEGIFTLNKPFYYKGTYEDVVTVVLKSDIVDDSPKEIELFHFGRLSPRMNIYKHAGCLKDKSGKTAKQANISIFRLKQSVLEKTAQRMAKDDLFAGGKKDCALVEAIEGLAMSAEKCATVFGADILKTAVPSKENTRPKRSRAFHFQQYASQMKIILAKAENDVSRINRQEIMDLFNKISLEVDALFKVAFFAKRKDNEPGVDGYPSRRDLSKEINKRNKIIDRAKKTLSIWTSINEEKATEPVNKDGEDSRGKYANLYLVVGRDCVLNLVLSYEIEELFGSAVFPVSRDEDIRKYAETLNKCVSEGRQINSHIGYLGYLLKAIRCSELFPNKSVTFLDQSILSSTACEETPYKIYDSDITYSIGLSFGDVMPSEDLAIQYLSRAVAYEHQYDTEAIWDDLLASLSGECPTDRFKPQYASGVEMLFLSERRCVLAVVAKHEPKALAGIRPIIPHVYRYQALFDYLQLVTSSIFSSMANSVNYLIGAMADITAKKNVVLRVLLMRAFANSASKASVRYGAGAMFKRSAGLNLFALIMRHNHVDTIAAETRSSIELLWQNANITVGEKYGILAAFFSLCSVCLAVITIGMVVSVTCGTYSNPVQTIFESPFVGIGLTVLLILLGLWIAYVIATKLYLGHASLEKSFIKLDATARDSTPSEE